MNLRLLASSAFLLCGIALVAYALHQVIDAALGAQSSVFDSLAQSIALALGVSIIFSFAFPHLRGIRRGDRLVAAMARTHSPMGDAFPSLDSVVVVALGSGRVGQKIRVALGNGRSAEGAISSYAGTFSLPSLQITEVEHYSKPSGGVGS
ncbi:hypothetical protein HY095_05435 [Candidatus Micrarchaeota archaeon]|nr:hypothetical protein [Candidatus Micrarchaeota archaeon]